MIRTRIPKGIIVALFCIYTISAVNCGGGTKSSASSDSSSRSSGPGMASFDDSNPKVVEAKARCEKEIEQSQTEAQEKLSSIQVHACMFALRPEMAPCVKGPRTEVTLKVIIGSDGSVVSVFPIGDTADTPAAKCAAEVVGPASFPQFSGTDQQIIKYPFTLE